MELWIKERKTGYRRGTGNDFIGPPHMRQMLWTAQYLAEICSKPNYRMKTGELGGSLKEFFGRTPSVGSLLEPMLPFLSLGVAAHPNHSRLILNLGSSDCKWELASGDEQKLPWRRNTQLVTTRVLNRRTTSKCKMITTVRIVVLDTKHREQFSFVRKLLEEPIPLDSKTDESWAVPHEGVPPRIALEDVLARAGSVVDEHSAMTPDIATHAEFCSLMGYDAPVHHTETPTVPSTLHLACHQIFGANDEALQLSNVTYHAQMKPSLSCIASVYADVAAPGSYISVLRVAEGEVAGQVLSTVIFSKTTFECCVPRPTK